MAPVVAVVADGPMLGDTRMPVRRALARALFRLSGWRKVGVPPRTGIFLGAPHTSNWDMVLMLMVLWADGIVPRVLAKRELFRGPGGWLMRRLGGIPTDRTGGAGLVARLVEEARTADDFVLVIAPEGTRRRTEHWKSGFYRLAEGTGLPLTLGFIDGPTRTAGVGETFAVTGDVRADMDRIRAFYADKRGVRPQRAGVVRLREESGVS